MPSIPVSQDMNSSNIDNDEISGYNFSHLEDNGYNTNEFQSSRRLSSINNEDDYDYAIELLPDNEYREAAEALPNIIDFDDEDLFDNLYSSNNEDRENSLNRYGYDTRGAAAAKNQNQTNNLSFYNVVNFLKSTPLNSPKMDGIGVNAVHNYSDINLSLDSFNNSNNNIEPSSNNSMIDGQHLDIEEVNSNSSNSPNKINKVIERKDYSLSMLYI